jgi:hypothetical protein
MMAGLQALGAWLSTDTVPLEAGSIAWLLAWAVCSAAVAWAGLHTWRAVRMTAAPGLSALQRAGARSVVAAVSLLWLAVLALEVAPQASERLQLAQGVDPSGQVQVLADANGRRLRLQGNIGLGDAGRVAAQLAALPQLQLLELQGGGVRMDEARRIARVVKERGLQTRLVGPCDNACAMVFLAGSSRQVMPGSQLGLSRPGTHWLDPLGASLVRHGWAKAWRQASLPEDFIARGLHAPPGSPWSPDDAHLQSSGLLGPPDLPLDVALPHGTGLAADDFAQALRSHWVWRAMQTRFPGSVELAADRMAARHGGGADADALQLAAQEILQAALPTLLATADSLLHEQFTALLADQLRSALATGDDACTGVLQADAAARRALPPALRLREAAWLKDALASQPATRPAQRRGDLEREVLRRRLGDSAPALLAALWGPQRIWGADPGCQRATQVLAAANQLPPSERRLAARLMFQSP